MVGGKPCYLLFLDGYDILHHILIKPQIMASMSFIYKFLQLLTYELLVILLDIMAYFTRENKTDTKLTQFELLHLKSLFYLGYYCNLACSVMITFENP